MDIKVVNPCPDEVAKLKAAGLAVVDVDPKGAFSKDVGQKTLQGVPILFGYNARLDMPEAVVYKMLKAFYDKKDELVKLDPGFTPMAKDFIGMQVQGINANPQIPVHRAWPSSSRSTRPGTTSGRSAAAAADRNRSSIRAGSCAR